MKIKIDKNGDEISEAGASYRLAIYQFFFSKIIINIVTVALFASVLALAICVVTRGLRTYAPIIVKVSGLVASVFIILLIFRSVFWKKLKK